MAGWDRLKGYRNKLHAVSTIRQSDVALYLVFTTALPEQFRGVIDSVAYQITLSIYDKLRAINAKDAEL